MRTGTYWSQAFVAKSIAGARRGLIVPVDNRAVTNHCAAKKFRNGVLLRQGKLCYPGGLRNDAPSRHSERSRAPACTHLPNFIRPCSDEIEELWNRIRAILRMEKCIGECRLLLKIWSLTQQAFQRMTRWQHSKRGDEVTDPFVCRVDAGPPAELLQHIDTGPAVRRIDHQVHCAVLLEDAAQSREAGVGVLEVMKNSGADNLIEGLSQTRSRDRWGAGTPEDSPSCISA